MGKKRRKQKQTKLSIDQIETRRIVLVDDYGNQRADISCSGGDGEANGFTVIHLSDHTGRPLLSLQVSDQGNSSITLFNTNNSPGVSMAVNPGRGNVISVHDGEGKPFIDMGVPGPRSEDPDAPSPRVTIFDLAKKKGWNPFTGTYEIDS
jgi:hypothetical protein